MAKNAVKPVKNVAVNESASHALLKVFIVGCAYGVIPYGRILGIPILLFYSLLKKDFIAQVLVDFAEYINKNYIKVSNDYLEHPTKLLSPILAVVAFVTMPLSLSGIAIYGLLTVKDEDKFKVYRSAFKWIYDWFHLAVKTPVLPDAKTKKTKAESQAIALKLAKEEAERSAILNRNFTWLGLCGLIGLGVWIWASPVVALPKLGMTILAIFHCFVFGLGLQALWSGVNYSAKNFFKFFIDHPGKIAGVLLALYVNINTNGWVEFQPSIIGEVYSWFAIATSRPIVNMYGEFNSFIGPTGQQMVRAMFVGGFIGTIVEKISEGIIYLTYHDTSTLSVKAPSYQEMQEAIFRAKQQLFFVIGGTPVFMATQLGSKLVVSSRAGFLGGAFVCAGVLTALVIVYELAKMMLNRMAQSSIIPSITKKPKPVVPVPALKKGKTPAIVNQYDKNRKSKPASKKVVVDKPIAARTRKRA